MSVFIYVSYIHKSAELWLQMIKESAGETPPEIFRSLPGFTARLRRPLDFHDIVVLLPQDETALLALLELYLEKLLDGLRLIIVLPDMDDQFIKIAHRMFPRYLTDVNSDLRETKDVLGNLITTSNVNLSCRGRG